LGCFSSPVNQRDFNYQPSTGESRISEPSISDFVDELPLQTQGFFFMNSRGALFFFQPGQGFSTIKKTSYLLISNHDPKSSDEQWRRAQALNLSIVVLKILGGDSYHRHHARPPSPWFFFGETVPKQSMGRTVYVPT